MADQVATLELYTNPLGSAVVVARNSSGLTVGSWRINAFRSFVGVICGDLGTLADCEPNGRDYRPWFGRPVASIDSAGHLAILNQGAFDRLAESLELSK